MLSGNLFVGTALAGDEIDAQRIYRSAYHLGRGDTGISQCENEDCLFYNPAFLAEGEGIYKKTILASPQLEMSRATRDFVRQIGVEESSPVSTIRQNIGKPNHVGVQTYTGILLRRAAFGAFASNNLNLFAFKDPENGGLETIDASATQNIGVMFSLAEKIGDNFALGFTGKYLQRGRGGLTASVANAENASEQLQNQNELLGIGTGSAADIGLLYKGSSPSSPSFGLLLANLGDTKFATAEPTEQDLTLKQTVNVGMSISPGTKFSKFRFLLDYRDILNNIQDNAFKKIHLGAELTLRDIIGITAGINQGAPTMGVYTDFWVLRLDAGMYTQEISEQVGRRPDNRFFLRLKAGL